MFFLIVLGIISAVACAPQTIIPYSYPIISHDIAPFIQGPIAPIPITPSIYPYPKFIPSYHRARSIIPKTMEDIPEIKLANADSALQYQKAMMGIPGSTIIRTKRDISGIIPSYNIPYIPSYTIPYSSGIESSDNAHIISSPISHN